MLKLKAPLFLDVLWMALQAEELMSVTVQKDPGSWSARAVLRIPDPPPTSTQTTGAWVPLQAAHHLFQLTSLWRSSSSSSRASSIRKLSSAGSYTSEYVGSAKTGQDTIGQTPDHNRQQLDVLDQVLVSSWSYSSANTSVWFVLFILINIHIELGCTMNMTMWITSSIGRWNAFNVRSVSDFDIYIFR